MKRVQDYNPPSHKRYDKVDRQAYLVTKIGMRLKRMDHFARTRVSGNFSSFKHALAIERGGSYLPKIFKGRR